MVPKVWVIAKSHLRRFWESRKADSEVAQKDLLTWFKLAESAEWANFGALKQTFGSADQVGNCVVFDAGNNRFRLIGRVFYAAGKLYILRLWITKSTIRDAGSMPAGATILRLGRQPEVKMSSTIERENSPASEERSVSNGG